MRFGFVLVLMTLASVACAPVTETSLRAEKKQVRTFTVDKPYQQVFQNLLDNSRLCFLKQPITNQFTVTGTRVNRDKRGEVVVAEVWSMKERSVFLLIDVEAVNDQQSAGDDLS